MIQISLSLLVGIYLMIFLTIVFVTWLWQEWQRQRREREALRHRLQCTICALEFEDRSDTILPRCPRCGSLNERFRIGTL